MTESHETILVETDARGVATVTLNRPDKHNALNGDLIAELYGAAVKLAADDTVRVVVLTGNGKSFCAGGISTGSPPTSKNRAPSGWTRAPRWRVCCAALIPCPNR